MAATVVERLTDWNTLITQINTLAQAPPSGCSAQSALTPVTAPHRWSKTDIQQMQTTLKAICSNNTFSTLPDKWQQSIIDELTNAIATGWCNCGCPCPNKAPQAVFFLGNWTRTGCTEYAGTIDCNPGSGALRAAYMIGQQAATACQQYAAKMVAACNLEKQIVIEMAKLVSLGHQRDAACAGEEAPLLPCQAAIEAVNAQQNVVAALSTQRGLLEISITALQTQADTYADQSMAALAALTAEPGDINLVQQFLLNYNYPSNVGWPQINQNTCCNPFYCGVTWSLQTQIASTTNSRWCSTTGWSNLLQGKFTHNGHPYPVWVYQCPMGWVYQCFSNNCSVGSTLEMCSTTCINAARLVISYPGI